MESWDGRFVYYNERPGDIWRVPVAGGEETLVLPLAARAARIAIAEGGLCFLTQKGSARHGAARYSIRRLDLRAGAVTDDFEGDELEPRSFLAVSPDEEWVLFTGRSLPVSELMLVESFR